MTQNLWLLDKAIQRQIVERFLHDLRVNSLTAHGASERHCVEANVVDVPWNTMAGFCDDVYRRRTKNLVTEMAGDLEPMVDVFKRFRDPQGLQTREYSDALT